MLNKLLGRTPPLPPAAAEAIDGLGRLAERRPELQELAAINAALLRAVYTRPLPALALALDPVHGATKLEAGQPLLRGETIRLDHGALRDQFAHLCGVMDAQGHTSAAALAQAARRDTLSIATIATATLNGEPLTMALSAADLGLDAGLAATLLRFTMFPILHGFMQEQRTRFELDTWRRGYCWCCGAWPLLGEFRGLEQARMLRCGLCASEWEIDRLVCPVCDNRVHQELLNLAVEGEETHQRAVACARCDTYVKQVSTLVPIPAAQLVVTDLETLHLDLIAVDRQYMAVH